MSGYDHLVTTLRRFAEQSKVQPLTLGEALDSLDEAAYALVALILVLPFLQPIPLGPLTVLGGLTFAALGWQLWHAHETPVLPEKIRKVAMSEKTWHVLATVCIKVVKICSKFTRPRYAYMVAGEQGRKLGAFILAAAGLLMAIPFGVLPLNNVLPGLAIVFYCIGELEQDGLMVIIGYVWLAITVVYFAAFFFVIYYFGIGAWNHFIARIFG